MVEKYFFEKDNETTINFGHFVEKVFNKHVDDYGEESAKKTRERVKNIYKSSVELVQSNVKNKNVLLIGKVQSGKTSNLEMFTAMAFDNGYKVAIIYGGYDTKLLDQTSSRFKKTFDVNEDSLSSEEPELFSTDDSESVNSLDEDVLGKIIELDKPIIFVSMKRPAALIKINAVLEKLSSANIPTFIIDDEGDQASLNTEIKNKKQSPTYFEIRKMKFALHNPLYLSVTATPQANVLLGEYSDLKPEKLFLIQPGDGYTGAEFFHLDDKHIVTLSPKDVETLDKNEVPHSIYEAINYFLIASAIMLKKGFVYTDMIIHTDRANKKHAEIFTNINNYISSLKENMDDEEFDYQLYEIKKIYNSSYFSQDILTNYPFETLEPLLEKVIQDTHLILQNSQGAATQGNLKYKSHKIYIGGDLLQRGLTFKYLITTYFTRWPKSSGNMDTTIQRARWFGYRSKFIDLCKIFTTAKIQEEYTALTESESDLWEQCIAIEKGELGISDIVIDANSSSLNPTRRNVVYFKGVKFSKKWNNQKKGFFDKAINDINNKYIESFLNLLEFKPSTVGRIGVNVPSCFYSYITQEQAIDLVSKTSSIFDYHPFNRQELKKLFSRFSKIVVQKMFGLYGKTDEHRDRTFYQETGNVYALQQGPDKADEALKKYKGDASVIVDEDAVTLQVFKIRPRFEKNKPLPEYDQYMFSIRIPEERKGFVKDESKG